MPFLKPLNQIALNKTAARMPRRSFAPRLEHLETRETPAVALLSSVSTLSAPITPSPVYGQAATFSVSVAAVAPATGTPSGFVAFQDGAANLGIVALTAGSANFTTTSLSVGTHTIKAVYFGDSTFDVSQATITQTIAKSSTTLTLNSLVNPAAVGEKVTLQVQVAATAPGAGIPTGTVTFTDGTSPLAQNVPLVNGIATFVASSLTATAHSFKVTYAGDAHFTAGTSNLVAQTIYTADQRFVQALYGEFLGRTGTVGELNYWVNLIPTLGNPGVVEAVARSRESLTHVVDEMYVQILGRPADGDGTTYWTNLLVNKTMTEEQVMAGLYTSPEFTVRANTMFGAVDPNSNYVQALYKLALVRPGSVDPAEINFWVNNLTVMDRSQVATRFLTSAEFRASAVRTLYGDPTLTPTTSQPELPNLLKRPVAPVVDEVNFWAGSNRDLLTLAIAIASTPEFYAHG